MQTFLPYSDFKRSAEVLDKKRCWKQVVEAKQIIDVLELKQKVRVATDDYASIGKTISWANHPAVQMWEGYTEVLKHYFNEFLLVCLEKHHIHTKYEFLYTQIRKEEILLGFLFIHPWWLGNKDFHRAMRSRLIEKNREFYLPLFPKDEGFNGGKYFWPVMETKTFKTI
jgi:hypothetical protein